jgi:hypothetical protein
MGLNRTLRALAPLLFALLIAGTCDRLLYARLQEDTSPDQPAFDIGSAPDYSGRAPAYAVIVTGIAWDSTGRADTVKLWHVFWEMHVDSGRKWIPLASVRYGSAPFYCHTTVGPDSLRAGFVYACDFRCYGLSPTVYFEIVSDKTGRRHIRQMTSEQFLHRVKRPK